MGNYEYNMKAFTLPALVLFACAAPVSADWVLTQTVGGKSTVTFISAAGFRQTGGQTHTIWRFKENALYFVNRANRQYSRVDAEAFLARIEQMFQQMQEKAPKPVIRGAYRKTGTAVVAGLPCDRYEKTTGARTTAMCVSTAIGVSGRLKLLITSVDHVNDPQADMPGLPLRVTEMAGGKEIVHLDTIRAEEKALPASDFELPAGYTEAER